MFRDNTGRRVLKPVTLDWALLLIVLFEASAFALLALRKDTIDTMALLYAVAVPAAMLLSMSILGAFFKGMDRFPWVIVHFLFGLGMIMQYRMNETRALRFAISYGVGLLSALIAMAIIFKPKPWQKRWVRYALMGVSVAMLAVSLVIGQTINSARSWLEIGGFSIQPSELVKVALPFVLAMSFTGKRTFIKLVPAWSFVAVSVLLLLMQRDLGAALIYFLVAVIMYYIATSDLFFTGIALGAGAIGSVGAYYAFGHVRDRVAIWRNPFKTVDTTGYQVVQGLMAIGSGGLVGLGLGMGKPTSIPLSYNDYIFAAICEEFGILMGLVVVMMYLLLIVRGAKIAMDAQESFYGVLAFGLTSVLGVQTFIIIGGVIKMIPLTGVTLPFVSYGGSSMLSCMLILGILEGISVMNAQSRGAPQTQAGGMMR